MAKLMSNIVNRGLPT